MLSDRKPRRQTFLRAWRKYRGMTQDQVAEILEMDRSTISKIENGVLPYDQDFLERTSLVYLCEPEDLISIDPLKPDTPRLVSSRMKHATPAQQKQIVELVNVLLGKAS